MLALLQLVPLVPCPPSRKPPQVHLSLYIVSLSNLISRWACVESSAAGLPSLSLRVPGTPLTTPEFPEAEGWG